MTIAIKEPSIEIMDINDPEATAMLQAFYSRSPKPIRERLRELDAEWLLDPVNKNPKLQPLKDKLNEYYVGYGHKSIGELGEFVIFIENVSFITAKAIQHHPLYKGQEVSTRYVDFSQQPIPPLGAICRQDNEKNQDLYYRAVRTNLEYYETTLEESYQRILEAKSLDEKDPVLRRAARAAAFDIARSKLPIFMCTSLAWKTDFSNAREHLMRLSCMTFPEVQQVTQRIANVLTERYPFAFGRHVTTTSVRPSLADDVRSRILNSGYICDSWWDTPLPTANWETPQLTRINKLMAGSTYNPYRDFYHLTGMMTFGTWRDLARHRNGMTIWPFPYLRIEKPDQFNGTLEENVIVSMVFDAKQLEYLMALRTQETVHQELRAFLHNAFNSLLDFDSAQSDYATARTEHYKHIETRMTPLNQVWSVKRGKQTIIKKGEEE